MMDEEERARLYAVKLKAKRGLGLTNRDLKWCCEMLEKDREGYGEVEREVVEEVRRDFTPGG